MKPIFNYSNYGNDIAITSKDAKYINHSGECEPEVLEVMKKQYMKKQLATLNPENLAKELKEYGAWDSDELSQHDKNLVRWVWLSACDIAEKLRS